MNFLTTLVLFFPLLVLGQTFLLFTNPGRRPVYVHPANAATEEPAYLSLQPNDQSLAAFFTFDKGNVTVNSVNVYLSKQSKYESVFRAEVGAIPYPPLYVFFDTWSISDQALRASVWWNPPKKRQWFWCPGGGRVY
jgi:hypothetical protein